MAKKIISPITIIILLSIVVLFLVLLIFSSNAKTKLILQENKRLSSNVETLDAGMSALNQKLKAAVLEVDRQRSELEETKNKLTQERLNNTQLKQQIEELKAGASSAPEGSGS